MKTLRLLPAILAAALAAGPAWAQWDDSVDWGSMLSPERLAKVLREARARRMAMERDQVAVEIREGLLFNPDRIDAAIKGLTTTPKDTWEDNARRICEAFAMVDLRLAKAWAALESGDADGARTIFKSMISERDTSYLAAAKQFCYARSLADAGKHEDAAEAYSDLVKNMPDRFSFAATALLRAAEAYEKVHRRYYAMSLYQGWVDSFGLLDPKLADELAKKADRIAADYEDPLKTLSEKMGHAYTRLAANDSGRQTQKKQKEVIEMLDDLIALAEENSGGGQGKGQGKGKGKGKGQGQGQGQGKGKGGSKRGPAAGIGVPSANATVSRLVGGNSPRPQGLSEIRPSDPSDDWGSLPLRERQKLLESFKESMPERYRQMIRDYYRKLAGQGRR
ncbi:hypothetical protein LCGC14_1534870 [marine sediment metagenome]|uniref:Tetratricopeptide repeat protein n=1 Tax=marine sediment metagenome TaxID=412755 RepID=A0A0F9LVM8_9ZZZZ